MLQRRPPATLSEYEKLSCVADTAVTAKVLGGDRRRQAAAVSIQVFVGSRLVERQVVEGGYAIHCRYRRCPAKRLPITVDRNTAVIRGVHISVAVFGRDNQAERNAGRDAAGRLRDNRQLIRHVKEADVAAVKPSLVAVNV